MINSQEELVAELEEKGFEQIIGLDSRYKTLARDYIEKDVATYERRFPHLYEEESSDCDDAAITSLFSEVRRAARKTKAFKGFGVPVALIIVTLSVTSRFTTNLKRGRHMSLLIKCSDGKWILYEKTNDQIYDFQDILDRMDFGELHFAMF